MSARPFAVGGRIAVPSVCIAAGPGSVGVPLVAAHKWAGSAPGQARGLPLRRDRVAQGGRVQAQRLQFERRLRIFDPEVATVNSSWDLALGFVIEGKTHGHKSGERGYPLVLKALIATLLLGR